MPQEEKEYLEALRLRPDLPSLHLELGQVYANSAQWSKAETEFRAEAKLRPGSAEAAYRLGAAPSQPGAGAISAGRPTRWNGTARYGDNS